MTNIVVKQKVSSMKVQIIGSGLVSMNIKNMEIGKQFYASEDDILITEDSKMWINVLGMVNKNQNDDFFIPIKKKTEDLYEVDLNIPWCIVPISNNVDFTDNTLDEFIGPFEVTLVKHTNHLFYLRMPVDALELILNTLREEELFEEMREIQQVIDLKRKK